jgi:hypothetical protein
LQRLGGSNRTLGFFVEWQTGKGLNWLGRFTAFLTGYLVDPGRWLGGGQLGVSDGSYLRLLGSLLLKGGECSQGKWVRDAAVSANLKLF